MSTVKRKRPSIEDDWGLLASSSSDTDSSDEEIEQGYGNKRQKTVTIPRLTLLPHELLCHIFILSSNPALPLTCRSLAYQLYQCQDSVKIHWLLYRHDNDIQAAFEAGVKFPFFTLSLLHRLDSLYQRQQQQQQQQLGEKGTKAVTCNNTENENDTTSLQTSNVNASSTYITPQSHEVDEGKNDNVQSDHIISISSNNILPYTKRKIPPYLFSRETRRKETDDMVTTLLERGGSPDKPKGYPLIKCAQLGRLDQVKQLIRYGANPKLRNNMALRVCAARNNTEMLLYFLDELKVTPDSETLKACAQKKLWNVVQVLLDHGAVPDMDTVNFI